MMIVPYRHTSKLKHITEDEYTEMHQAIIRCIDALDATSKPHGYNIGSNLGRIAGAGIDKHIHFHIVPRWSGDTNFMPILSDTKLVSEELQTTWRTLIKKFKLLNN
jgi:ATP adenylyltransferase